VQSTVRPSLIKNPSDSHVQALIHPGLEGLLLSSGDFEEDLENQYQTFLENNLFH